MELSCMEDVAASAEDGMRCRQRVDQCIMDVGWIKGYGVNIAS